MTGMPVTPDEGRPSAAPDSSSVNGAPATVSRALRLIEDGLLDHANIDALCERLGIGARQLRRLFHKHLGTSPVQVASIRRAQFARRLIETTQLSMAHVARAAGFGSVRRFNAVMNDRSASRKMVQTGFSGFYLAVHSTGSIAAEDAFVLKPGSRDTSIASLLNVARFKARND